MSRTRAFLAVLVTLVAVVIGPTLATASFPCLECEGVCGAAVNAAPVVLVSVLFALSAVPEADLVRRLAPARLSELPPRPLRSTV